jgi:hypothetical protein
MQMREDRVSGEANATQLLTLPHAIARSHRYASSLHMHEQAVLAILMIEQHEIARYPSDLCLGEVSDTRSWWPSYLQTSSPECHLQLREQRLHPAHRLAGRSRTSYLACEDRRDTRALAHPDK